MPRVLVRNGRIVTASESYEADLYVDGGRVAHSPYEGRVVRGGPVVVMSRGEVIVDHGEWKGRAGRGEFLKRQHPHTG